MKMTKTRKGKRLLSTECKMKEKMNDIKKGETDVCVKEFSIQISRRKIVAENTRRNKEK